MKVLKPRSSNGGIEFGGRERMPNLRRSNKIRMSFQRSGEEGGRGLRKFANHKLDGGGGTLKDRGRRQRGTSCHGDFFFFKVRFTSRCLKADRKEPIDSERLRNKRGGGWIE